MSIKIELKNKAVSLRKQGKSYSEILKEIPIAKSTLSLWLRDVGLSKKKSQRLTEKRLAAVKRGGLAKKTLRINSTKKIFQTAKAEIGCITDRELFLIGTALYWAEGSKQKAHNLSEGVIFSNSDSSMVTIFHKWLKLLKIPEEDISFSIYLHKSSQHRTNEVRAYWSKTLKLSITRLEKVYYKNTGLEYNGLIRVRVKRSTDLNRRITGWVQGIVQN
jgi:hypothetical protein